MALGDLNVYPLFKLGKMNGTANIVDVDLDSDTIKLAVMDNGWTPSTNFTTDNFWDDVSANQVATATAYTGPITLTTTACALNGNDADFTADDVVIAQDGSGFADGRWIVIYKDTGTPGTSALLAYGDLGADQSIVTSSLTFNWGTAIFRF